MDPSNRRITIIVMNKDAEERLTRGGGQIEVEDPEDLAAALAAKAEAAAPGGAAPASGSPAIAPTSSAAPVPPESSLHPPK
jgi:hypothetical protein